jgi:hypothetical protein
VQFLFWHSDKTNSNHAKKSLQPSMSKAQVVYFNLGGKRMRITVEETEPTFEPGTIVIVECGSRIVNDTDDSDASDEDTSRYPAVLLATNKNKAIICWLLDTKDADIQLPKARWPPHWKQPDVFVLDTMHETVALTSVTKHSNPESMIIATRCYNSRSKLVAKDTYTAVLVAKTAELNK